MANQELRACSALHCHSGTQTSILCVLPPPGQRRTLHAAIAGGKRDNGRFINGLNLEASYVYSIHIVHMATPDFKGQQGNMA